MSLVEELHAAHKARLSRMGARSPYQAPVIAVEKTPIKPHTIDAGWEGMWFYDLLQGFKEPRQTVPIKEIQEAVSRHYGISVLDLISDRRGRAYALPRQVAMYFCRTLSPHSYAEIGRRFGGRDHSTVLYGSQKIENALGYDVRVTCDVNTLRKVLA